MCGATASEIPAATSGGMNPGHRGAHTSDGAGDQVHDPYHHRDAHRGLPPDPVLHQQEHGDPRRGHRPAKFDRECRGRIGVDHRNPVSHAEELDVLHAPAGRTVQSLDRYVDRAAAKPPKISMIAGDRPAAEAGRNHSKCVTTAHPADEHALGHSFASEE
jgi:hypothetical protein